MPHACRAHCTRCAQEVDAVRPWAGYLWLKRGWFAGLLLLLGLMPIILSEITVLLPLAMVFAMAGGPLLMLSSQPVTCSDCGAEISPPAKPGSPQTR
jgi:hypothetical protein